MFALYTSVIQEKVTYAAARRHAGFPSIQFHSISDPACGWLPLIGGQYVFALSVSSGAKTSWWDCFCWRFPRVCNRPCMTTIMLLARVIWLITSFLCHIPPLFRKVMKPSWNPAEKESAKGANTFMQRANMSPTGERGRCCSDRTKANSVDLQPIN